MLTKFQQLCRPDYYLLFPASITWRACPQTLHRIPFMRVCAGPLATTNRELRQARKGAAVAAMSGAGVWLARAFCFLPAKILPTVCGTTVYK